jgi:hypothetical protein
MQEIGKVLRRKRAQYAQLGKEIELLQEAEVKLREVASLLADNDEDEDESAVLADVDDQVQSNGSATRAASAAAGNQRSASQASGTQTSADQDPTKSTRPVALRWP